MFDIPFESPNRLIAGRLKYENEIRFGPRYYSLYIQNHGLLRNRIFGGILLWSDDSKYLALQEWMTTNESDGPWTRLLLFDFQTKLGSHVTGAKGGFVKPIKFEGEKIVYVKELQNVRSEFDVKITSITNWEHLDWV
jgi:hypothetical protein